MGLFVLHKIIRVEAEIRIFRRRGSSIEGWFSAKTFPVLGEAL
jgi:hypothetical protein